MKQGAFILKVGALMVLLQSSAWAEFAATPEEHRMCQTTIYSRIVKGDPNWMHVHHYCDCVRFTNRAFGVMGRNQKDFMYFLDVAIDGCDYVFGHTTPDFELLGEVHTQKGIALALQKQDALAAAEFNKALGKNRKLPKAYLGLVNFYTKAKNKAKALEIAGEGLKFNPESKALLRQYKDLGGTQPLPSAQAVAIAPGSDAKPTPTEGRTGDSTPAKGASDGKEPAADTGKQTEPPPASIGSPSNPWCRFCTDTPATPAGATPSTPGVIPKGAP